MKTQTRFIGKAVAVLLLTAGMEAAAQDRGKRSEGQRVPAARGGGKQLPLRARLGILGGVAMQKTDFALGVGYDLRELPLGLRLVADLTLGLRPTEITLEPMVGVRLPLALSANLPLEVYVAGLAGVNLTLLRGGTGVALPVRIATGAHYQAVKGIGFGMELALELGPLIVPFAATYAAVHFNFVAAFEL